MNPIFTKGDTLVINKVPRWSYLIPYKTYLIEDILGDHVKLHNINDGGKTTERYSEMVMMSSAYEYKILLTNQQESA